MPIPLLLALLSVSAAVRFGRVIIYLNAQILLKSFSKSSKKRLKGYEKIAHIALLEYFYYICAISFSILL